MSTEDSPSNRGPATLSPEVIAAALGQFAPTPEQSAVIASPMTPALVVAGAGSGKTETMASRVVWLVANGWVRRDQVLGLTFTRKAAGELAERINARLHRLGELERRGLLPHLPRLHAEGKLAILGNIEREGKGDAARRAAFDALSDGVAPIPDDPDALLFRPTVSTYNSFADAIVRENAVRLGRDAETAVLSESAAWLLMRQVVFASDDERLDGLDFSVSSVIDAALRIARDGVDNLVDFSRLAQFPEAFSAITERPSENARVKTAYAAVTDAVTRVDALAVLSRLAQDYHARKQRTGVIDFADQVAGALRAVSEHPGVGEDLRERYRVVLLDEYQDTSVAQTDLLSTAFRGEAVMAVGDPHQSIYGWRGASAGNLGDFGSAFADGVRPQTFSLMTSWRNSESVLAAANAVLEPLTASSPVDVGELRPRSGAPSGRVEIVIENDVDAEAERVAVWFEHTRAERLRAGQETTGAVLFRSKKHMSRFAAALGRRGIPHRILGLGGLLSTPEVVDVVSALRVISDPMAGSALIRLLAGPRWSIGIADLRALADLSRRLTRHDAALQPLAPDVLERLRAGVSDGASLSDALDFFLRYSPEHGWLSAFSDAAKIRLREAASVWAGLRRAATLPLPELVRLIEIELRLDVELAAHESRGSARTAHDQLRAFLDELAGFMQTDDSGSLSNLLAWLDRAEDLDEFAPRTEPPEADVVQLLTIHGSKGLEWDAVAVVRMVEDELPGRLRTTQGWTGFGVLPYDFRGDSRWLPSFDWQGAQTQQDLRDALDAFKEGLRARHLEEERRLGYVAITRARDHLLLSASAWAGTKEPRQVSRFLRESATAVGHEIDDDLDTGDNPYEGGGQTLQWPMDALGARRARVEAAARAVQLAQTEAPAEPEGDLALLLAERAMREMATSDLAPTRIPASRFKEFATDYAAAVRAVLRPLPERPYREAQLGTRFHAWVEQRSGLTGAGSSLDDTLWSDDDDLAEADSAPATTAEERSFEELKERFLASEWAPLKPTEVEVEINFTADDLLPDGRPHIVICKLDAVYERAGRVEIVDWKTGRPPRNARERDERMLQLELYRRAYHEARGVPMDRIDVVLYYVADDLILRA